MTDWVSWFHTQLKASADGFVWAFEQMCCSLYCRRKSCYLLTSCSRKIW